MDFLTEQVKKKFDKKPETFAPATVTDPNHNKTNTGHTGPTHNPVSNIDPTTHKPATNAELMASAKIVAEAAQAASRHDTSALDKAKVAGAAADILDAASRYGKFDEKSGVGQYLEKAEQYLHKYETSHAHSPGGGSHGAVGGSHGGGNHGGGNHGAGSHGAGNHGAGSHGAVGGSHGGGSHGGVGGAGAAEDKKKDEKHGGGFGDYAKMAQDFIKK